MFDAQMFSHSGYGPEAMSQGPRSCKPPDPSRAAPGALVLGQYQLFLNVCISNMHDDCTCLNIMPWINHSCLGLARAAMSDTHATRGEGHGFLLSTIQAKVNIGYECNCGLTYPVVATKSMTQPGYGYRCFQNWDLMIHHQLGWEDCQ